MKLIYNIYPTDRDNHRYIQIGYQDVNGFTGMVYDYIGGGCFEDFWFVDGVLIGNIDYDGDEIRMEFNEKRPNVEEEIDKIFEEFGYFDEDGDLLTTDKFKEMFDERESENAVFTNGDLMPVEVGLSYFTPREEDNLTSKR